MTKTNRLTLSLVIPAYNEESHLAACLRSALAQDRPFDEIIVVDNNSTDDTAAIAALFPSVKVVHEHRQGVVNARATGFSTASGEIIARIDADTLLPVDWTATIETIFADGVVDAVSGAIFYHDVYGSNVEYAFDHRIRAWMSRHMTQNGFLLGSNMAIRRNAWQDVAAVVCHGDEAEHEDLDLAIHLSQTGHMVTYAPELVTGVSGRRIDTNIIDFIRYLNSMPRTYALHDSTETKYIYPVAGFVLLNYALLRICYRGYDSETGGFSARKVFGTEEAPRVNPVTFVD